MTTKSVATPRACTYIKVSNDKGKIINKIKIRPRTLVVNVDDNGVTLIHPVFYQFNGGKRFDIVAQSIVEDKREAVVDSDELEEVTTFLDNEGIQPTDPLYCTSTLKTPADPYRNQELNRILQRNFPILELVWDGGMGTGGVLGILKFPEALITQPLLTDIFNRFRFLRSGVKLSVRINATPFHYGQLLISWLPAYTYPSSFQGRFNTIYAASANPHVICSANKRSVTMLSIPWTAWCNYVQFKTSIWPNWEDAIGVIQVSVLTPLRTINMTDVPRATVSIFANFEDLEYSGIIAQSDSLDKEAERKSQNRTLSTLMDSIGNVSLSFARSPFSAYALKLAAFSKLSAVLLRAAGYSRETDRCEKTRVVPFLSSNFALGTGMDLSDKLALDGGNHVTRDHKEFSTLRDYDNIHELKLIPALVTVIPWTTETVGQRLLEIPVSPHFRDFVGVGALAYPVRSPLRALAYLNGFWTGGMKYSIRFVTSNFLTGRVRVVWQPMPSLPVMNVEGGNVVSAVVDIAGDTIFNFTIPYLHNLPWLYNPYSTSIDTIGRALNRSTNGYLSIYVVNPLVAGQVDSSLRCEIVVYASGAEDLRVAFPVQPSISLNRGIDPELIEAQSLVEGEDLHPRVLFQKTFPGLVPCVSNITVGPTMGEETTKVSQMLTRFTRVTRLTIADGASVSLYPLFEIQWMGTIAGVQQSGLDTLKLLMSMFGFAKGSMRVKIVPIVAAPRSYMITNVRSNQTSITATPFAGCGIYGADKPVAEVEIPYFRPVPLASNMHVNNDAFGGSAGISILNTAGISMVCDVYYAIGEDFSLGFPTSCPEF